MKALLSIKPEFVEKIFSEEKKYEFRKIIFKRDVDTVVNANQKVDHFWSKRSSSS